MRTLCRLLVASSLLLCAVRGYALQSSTTTATANPAYLTQSDTAVINVVVAPASGTGVAPTGEVDFTANGNYLSYCYLGQGSCAIQVFSGSVPPGTSLVVATYRGDGNYAGSASAQVQIYDDNTTPPPAPVFSPPSGTYSTPQLVSLSSAAGTNIYYTFTSTALANYTLYTGPFVVSSSGIIQAYARLTADPLVRSPLTLVSYQFAPASQISGFSQTTVNGSASVNSSTLRLTSAGKPNQAGSAFTTAPQSIQSFTSDFNFVLTNNPGTNPDADGIMFVIQNQGPKTLGGYGVNLGFGGIEKSAGIKFDLYDNDGEGNNSTGLYLNGVRPSLPATDLTPSGVDLHSARPFHVHMTYDGTTLSVTTTDELNRTNTATQTYTVDLPSVVGSSTAYVGFTGGTGGLAAQQTITSWTYVPGTPTATPVFSPAPGSCWRSVEMTGWVAR